MIHLPNEFDRLIEDIARAGEQLTAMAACEGAAGNISIFTTSLECPLEVVDEVELPTAAASLADGWMIISASGRRLRDVGRHPESTIAALHINDDGTRATMHANPSIRPSPEGVALAPFQVPGSSAQMEVTVAALAETVAVVWAKHGIVTRSDTSASAAADLVEYIEAAAHYEVMNLSLGSPAEGMNADERAAVANAFGLGV